MSSESSPTPPEPEVRRQLERILSHRDFEASERTRRFLRFVVDEALAGRGAALKGYAIAVEVFGRGPDFDANLDPIVRIQAGQLRRALDHYYLAAGGDDPVVIEIPKGGYSPHFVQRRPAGPGGVAGQRSRRNTALPDSAATLAVLPLRPIDGTAETGFFAAGMTEELCNELTRYQDLSVTPCRRNGAELHEDANYALLSDHIGARFLLDGSVRANDGDLKVTVRLIDGRADRQVWAEGYHCGQGAGRLIETQEEVARSVAAAVASEYGIISQRLASETRAVPPSELSAQDALLQFYVYEASPTLESGARCFSALREVVSREPECGPAWSALAVLLCNAYIMDLPGAEKPRERAAEFAQRGAGLAPRNQLARGAMAQSYFLQKERDAFLREIEATLQLNPGSPFYVGVAGYLLILADEHGKGLPLLERAVSMSPAHPRWFHHGLFVVDYQQGDYERAYGKTLRAGFDVHFWGHLLRTAVLGQLGRSIEARAAASRLLAIVPDFEVRARDLVARPILSESIVDRLLDGLRRAGLRI